MTGKKRNTKKAANSKKLETEQTNDCTPDEGEVETTKIPANKRGSKRAGAANNEAEELKGNDVEDKKQTKKDGEESKEDGKDSTSESTKTSANNATPANKRSKRSGAANNETDETTKKDGEESKEDGTSDNPKANNTASSKRSSKRTSTANNNFDEVSSSPKILRRDRRETPKEEGTKTDNGKTKPSLKEKPQGREYEVEAIMGKRKTKGVEEFLVKWKGYSEKENSWEPKKNLNCQRLLDEFLKNKN